MSQHPFWSIFSGHWSTPSFLSQFQCHCASICWIRLARRIRWLVCSFGAMSWLFSLVVSWMCSRSHWRWVTSNSSSDWVSGLWWPGSTLRKSGWMLEWCFLLWWYFRWCCPYGLVIWNRVTRVCYAMKRLPSVPDRWGSLGDYLKHFLLI